MKHIKRQYINASQDYDRYISFVDYSSYYRIFVRAPKDVCLSEILVAACMFKLPVGAFAYVDVYEYRPPQGEKQFVFSYEVHLSSAGFNATKEQLDEVVATNSNDRAKVVEMTERFDKPKGFGPGDLPGPATCDGIICENQTGPLSCDPGEVLVCDDGDLRCVYIGVPPDCK